MFPMGPAGKTERLPRIGFVSPALKAAQQKLDELGVEYVGPQAWPVRSEGDIRKHDRPAGEKSDYFYDPVGNRIQLVCWAN
jgi:hypothetical protein